MVHPYQSTIDLIEQFVNRLPPKFPAELGRYMVKRVSEFRRDPSIPGDVIDQAIAEFGLYLWHYRKAFAEIIAREGAPQVESRFLEMLSGELRARVQADAQAGFAAAHSTTEIMRLPAFESAYSPEEKLIIEESLLGSRRAVEEELRAKLDRGEIEDYETIVLRWKQERLRIEEQLLALRRLAKAKPQLASEILDAVATAGRGLAGIDREPTLEEVRKKVEDYRNMA